MSAAHQLYLDRFEGDMAVLMHEGIELAIPRELLPAEAKEGDYLQFSLSIDPEARNAAGHEISELQERLQSRDPGQQ